MIPGLATRSLLDFGFHLSVQSKEIGSRYETNS